MGIRYYAYAFDNDQTDQALADPSAFISSDPLADAWGLQPHACVATATFEQAVPERDMLYLDKAWRDLQLLTGPRSGSARPSYRMFEGKVDSRDGGWTWKSWTRVLTPAEVEPIARDLGGLTTELADARLRRAGIGVDEVQYVLHYLGRARLFAEGLVGEGRGMVYMIG